MTTRGLLLPLHRTLTARIAERSCRSSNTMRQSRPSRHALHPGPAGGFRRWRTALRYSPKRLREGAAPLARQSLARLLDEDRLGACIASVTVAESRAEKRAAKRFPAFPEVAELVRTAPDETRRVIAGTDWSDPEQVKDISELLGVAAETLLRYRREREAVRQAWLQAAGIPDLKRSWALSVRGAPIRKATRTTLRAPGERPLLVLFTADWCRWCWVVKPTFARLSHHFTAAKLFYTDDEDLAREECEVLFWPQLVGYPEDGGKVATECGETTRELWEDMHRVVGAAALAHA